MRYLIIIFLKKKIRLLASTKSTLMSYLIFFKVISVDYVDANELFNFFF
jgi:hypothetical protein